MERIVEYNNKQYVCRYFLDIMFLNQGIDILDNGFLIAIIPDLVVPDEFDIEENEYFDNEVRNYLAKKFAQ